MQSSWKQFLIWDLSDTVFHIDTTKRRLAIAKRIYVDFSYSFRTNKISWHKKQSFTIKTTQKFIQILLYLQFFETKQFVTTKS